MKGWCTALAGAGFLAGCNLAPTYDPPHTLLPDSYQGSGAFRVAQPEDALSPRGDWWTLFGDEQLNQLEEQLGRENPTLAAAGEIYTQARDLAAEAQSRLYPQIGLQALVSDNRESAHHLFSAYSQPRQEASNVIEGTASWEPDFWGAIRNTAHAQKRLAQASAADLATARLSLEAELANDYIAVRGYDVELEVLRQSIVAYQKAVEVARLRMQGKIASDLDLARALSELDSAQAQETETHLQRDLMQHAVAVLVNAMPSTFSIAPVKEFTLTPPQVPAGVPSELLQRRPDIASAERQMAAALFEGGLRRAELQRSWSQYAQTRDGYRSTVLASFQEVEDGLSLTRRLATEVAQQREASDQAVQALTISTMLYEDGLDNYLSVAVAQVTALAAQTAEVQIFTRQMQASVSLIRALGGGWTVQSLPTEKQTLPFGPLDYHAVKY
jgi:outer membrane protein, multidrug efflux system